MRPIWMALRENRPAEGLLRARLGILRRGFQGADELLLCLVELRQLQGRRTQLRGDESDHERQVFLQALRPNLERLRADTEGDFGADVVELLGDRKFVERFRATVEHHAGQGRNGNVPGLGHRIAGRQRP